MFWARGLRAAVSMVSTVRSTLKHPTPPKNGGKNPPKKTKKIGGEQAEAGPRPEKERLESLPRWSGPPVARRCSSGHIRYQRKRNSFNKQNNPNKEKNSKHYKHLYVHYHHSFHLALFLWIHRNVA